MTMEQKRNELKRLIFAFFKIEPTAVITDKEVFSSHSQQFFESEIEMFIDKVVELLN